MAGESIGNSYASERDRNGALPGFRSRLRTLKSEGCNLLVVGDPSREVFTRASGTMLGDPDARRWRVLALTDADPESVYDRLPAASVAPRPPTETTRVLNHATPPRPITETTDGLGATVPEVTVGDANLAGLRSRLCEAVADFGARSRRPSALRVAVDSLAPLLAHYESDVVRRFLRTVGDRVREHDAMAHYVLPEPYDGDRCRRLADEFDAVVELRTVAGDPEERWHLPDSGVTTPWVPL
ncbi:DUF7504 family protein [Halorussus halobius]|uniref:DUF7504 family protein n=1 Tax=Halorussus halobius TaxID=1710537 RepID=UPI00109319DE|nr:hypothetical protein [Halorussus halobius]